MATPCRETIVVDSVIYRYVFFPHTAFEVRISELVSAGNIRESKGKVVFPL